MAARMSLLRLVSATVVVGIFAVTTVDFAEARIFQVQPPSATPALSQPNTAKVGIAGEIYGVIISGTPLKTKPNIDDLAPIVVRIKDIYPHGDAWRYDIEFMGFEPGDYHLADFLEREDGSGLGTIPEVIMSVRTELPPGQILPHELDVFNLPRIGGYNQLAMAATVAWFLTLGYLIFGLKKKRVLSVAEKEQDNFASYLRQRLQSARSGTLSPEACAELERMLISFWRKKLKLEDRGMAESLRDLKQHADAGPVLLELERAIHAPGSLEDVDFETLLQPYKVLSLEEVTLLTEPETNK